MDNKKFTFWNRIVALVVFLVASVTYLMTIEPTASFWDCGEFIASSYKLEVGHPPGNPVFQLFARVATMFTGAENAAVAVNAMNAILSALTILLLYLTTVFLVKRLVRCDTDGSYSLGKSIAIFGSGAVAALAYTFSDTFWFSAVEGEVYAMSSLFTALVFWAMTRWYEQADEPYSNRWLVLIAFLMGLSIGVHLLNLLTIPALVFMFFYRKRESMAYTPLQLCGIFLVSVVILAVILYGIIPYLPIIAAYVDLFFVNTLGLPFNSGAAFFMLTLLGLCFYGLFATMKKGMALANTVLLCFTMIVIGFSLFTIVIIRSSAKTPTNEYQPDNPFTLVRYLGREQYGSNPLVYGHAFDSPYSFEEETYWAPLPDKNGDRYENVKGPDKVVYPSEGKMFFPRMWSSSSESHKNFYRSYMGDDPKVITYEGEDYEMPTFSQNLEFFFDFQMNWMYWRYFMWNFAGRQNDLHGESPNQFAGNWESGIGFLDEFRLGDQSDAPGYLKDNKGKNHYYMLPLLLGLIGIFFQFSRDKRGSWITFLMFFMTGIAIVIYLNQPPYQVRERDYAYAGSFYAFSIWIGMAVVAIYSWIMDALKNRSKEVAVASATTAVLLGVPVLMAAENWDDHDRSNRYTAVEMAANYLNSVGENGILVTHGDNDTFPLWYAQEVEGIRTDVRIANTSLLGTDWHIDQMKWACNNSAPLKLTLGPRKYLYGTNEYMIIDPVLESCTVQEVIAHINDDSNRLYLVEFSLPQVDAYLEKNYNLESQTYQIYVGGKKKADLASCILKDSDFTRLVDNLDSQLMEMLSIGVEDITGPLSAKHIRVEGSKELGAYIPTRKIIMPVDKENVLKNNILPEKYADRIPEQIVLTLSKDKQYVSKPEIFMLDFLAGYDWDRPLHMLNMGGDVNVGQKEYLMWEGFSYKFVPVKNKMSSTDIGFADADDIYYKMKNVFKWDALKRTDYFVDYQNYCTFCGVLSQRQIFVNASKEMIKAGEFEKAVELLDMCQECVPSENYPLDIKTMGFANEYWVLQMIDLYYSLGESRKAETLLAQFMDELTVSKNFFAGLGTPEADDLYMQVTDYIRYALDMYVNEILVSEDLETGEVSEKIDAVLDWVSLKEMPTDVIWCRLIDIMAKVGRVEEAESLAMDYAVGLSSSMDSLVREYNRVYKEGYAPLYDRYSSSKISNSDLAKLVEYKDMLTAMDERMGELVDVMSSLYYTAYDVDMTEVEDYVYEKLMLFSQE